MRIASITAALGLFACVLGSANAAIGPSLPPWFPIKGLFSINPDQLTAENYGVGSFKIARGTNSDDYEEREIKGHHWATSLYPPGAPSTWDRWNGEAAWRALKPQLEQQGFKTVYLKQDPGNSVDATFAKQDASGTSYVAIFLTNDAYSNNLVIVQTAASTLSVTLTPPTAAPEKFGDKDNFPYLSPLPGAKLLTTQSFDGPLDVTTPADSEPRLVGSAYTAKMYDGPPGISNLEFVNVYSNALTNAGWTVTDKNEGDGGGYLYAHYGKNGRDIWAKLSRDVDRWYITIADTGAGLQKLAATCKVALYGVNFDFNKANLRSDSEPVLQQVLALFHQDTGLAGEIGGHTDNVGGAAYNMKLSQDRADSVKGWLIAHGVAANRLTARGYGDTMPVVANTTDVNRARNRRVELKRPACVAAK